MLYHVRGVHVSLNIFAIFLALAILLFDTRNHVSFVSRLYDKTVLSLELHFFITFSREDEVLLSCGIINVPCTTDKGGHSGQLHLR